MAQDTVLIGAFGFFAIGGAVWLILNRLQASDLPDRVKRLITYGLLGSGGGCCDLCVQLAFPDL